MVARRSLAARQSLGPSAYKRQAIEEAQQQQAVIDNRTKRSDDAPVKYVFQELIGKGAYGRVYKSRRKDTNSIVAIKVLETDEMDFNARVADKDGGMQDALKEIDILQRLKQGNARNVNMFIEAFQIHSQLWIVSEYCSGGSLNTLRRGTGNRLEERHIRAIARELAIGLKSVHDAGIVHRDIKCSNVMISETGALQIIDFGVSGILISSMEEDKRRTVIGTPHWMAPELQKNTAEIAHGTEVDVWAYGITLFECAKGAPPNAAQMPGRQLQMQLRQAPAPRLEDDKFSAGLKDLVAQVLDKDHLKRPSMAQICKHEYLVGSEAEYPTSSLKELVEKYYNWERAGGQRHSLFFAGGAAQPKFHEEQDEDEWTFSTTAAFDILHDPEEDFADSPSANATSFLSDSPPRELDDYDFDPSMSMTLRPGDGSSASEAPTFTTDPDREAQVRRGAKALGALFDKDAAPYKNDGRPISDLPLRTGDSGSTHRKELSISSSDGGTPSINLGSIDSKKNSKRKTMEWKWGDNVAKGESALQDAPAMPLIPPARPGLHHANTFAMGEAMPKAAANRGTLNLDDLMADDMTPQPNRGTMDLDAMFGAGQLPQRNTLDLDAMMGQQPPSKESLKRQTFDLDAAMAQDFQDEDYSLTQDYPQSQNYSQAQGYTQPQDYHKAGNRDTQTIDLDELWGQDDSISQHQDSQNHYAHSNQHSRQPSQVSQHDYSHYYNQQQLHRSQSQTFSQPLAQSGASIPGPGSPVPSSRTTSARQTMDLGNISASELDEMMSADDDSYNMVGGPSRQPSLYDGAGGRTSTAASSTAGPSSSDDATMRVYDLNSLHAATLRRPATSEGFASSPPDSPSSLHRHQRRFGSQTIRDLDRSPDASQGASRPLTPRMPLPVAPAALRDDAPPEAVQRELERVLADLDAALDFNLAFFEDEELLGTGGYGNGMSATNGSNGLHGSGEGLGEDDGFRKRFADYEGGPGADGNGVGAGMGDGLDDYVSVTGEGYEQDRGHETGEEEFGEEDS